MATFSEKDNSLQKRESLKFKARKRVEELLPNDPQAQAHVRTQFEVFEDNVRTSGNKFFSPTQIGTLGISSNSSVDRLKDSEAGDEAPSYDDNVNYQRLISVAYLYFLANLEKAGLFRGVTKLVELFNAGKLRLSNGDGAELLYQLDRTRLNRYSTRERMQSYSRVFGYTKIKPPRGAQRNTSFQTLFVAFIKSVEKFFRDKRVSEVIRPNNPGGSYGSIATVRRNGLDLRNNLKNASYGHVSFLRQEVHQLQSTCIDILDASDVKKLYGTDDPYDTLEEILRQHLNEDVHVSDRLRLAEAGEQILLWLARPDITNRNRSTFEAALVEIGEYAEEWLTIATSLHELSVSPSSSGHKGTSGHNIIPLRGKVV